MPDKWPLANGNWSNAANWNGGTLPVDGDDIFADNRTVTIDQNINLPNARLWTTARSGGTAGGFFQITNSFNVTVAQVTAGTVSCLGLSGTGVTHNLNLGIVTASQTTVNAHGVAQSCTGTVNYTNTTFIGGSGGSRFGLQITTNANTTFTNCTARGGIGGVGVNLASPATLSGRLNLVQNAASTASALSFVASGITATLTGDVNHQGTASTVTASGTTAFTYTCLSQTATGLNLVPGNSGLWANSAANSTFLIDGTVADLSLPSGMFLFNSGASATVTYRGNVKLNIDSSSFARTSAAGTIVHDTGTLTGPDAQFLACGISMNSGGGTDRVILNNIAAGLNGHLPALVSTVRFKATSQIITRDNSGAAVTLVPTTAVGDPPLQSNVRSGVTYHFGTLTGSCAVPAAGSVATGVPIDNTVGTATLTQANVITAMENLSAAALARFVTVDTGQTNSANGSVARLAGGNVDTAAIAAAVEAALLNEADGRQLLAAISTRVQQLFDAGTDVPVATLVSLIAAEILANPANKLATGAGGVVTVGTNNDKTGYSLQTPPPTTAQITAAIEALQSYLTILESTQVAANAGQN